MRTMSARATLLVFRFLRLRSLRSVREHRDHGHFGIAASHIAFKAVLVPGNYAKVGSCYLLWFRFQFGER
jgi:hypothetical protein